MGKLKNIYICIFKLVPGTEKIFFSKQYIMKLQFIVAKFVNKAAARRG